MGAAPAGAEDRGEQVGLSRILKWGLGATEQENGSLWSSQRTLGSTNREPDTALRVHLLDYLTLSIPYPEMMEMSSYVGFSFYL